MIETRVTAQIVSGLAGPGLVLYLRTRALDFGGQTLISEVVPFRVGWLGSQGKALAMNFRVNSKAVMLPSAGAAAIHWLSPEFSSVKPCFVCT